MFYIFSKQIDKATGKMVGIGRSTKGYKTAGIAARYKRSFEFDNEKFRSIAVVAEECPFNEE